MANNRELAERIAGILLGSLLSGIILAFAVSFSSVSLPSIPVTHASSSTNVVASANVQYLCDLTFSSNQINLGSTTAGAGDSTSTQLTVYNSNGNLVGNTFINGYTLTEAGGNTLGVTNVLWNPTSSGSVGAGNQLTAISTNTQVYEGTGASNSLYFGLNTLPISAGSGSYQGNVLFVNSCEGTTPNTNSVYTNEIITVTVTGSCTIQLSATGIGFGQLKPSQYAPTSNQIVDTNTGGATANIYIYGSNWVSGSNNFFVANTLWNPSSAGQDVGNALTLGVPLPQNTNIYLPANTGTAQSNSIYFGVHIPGAQPFGVYTENIAIENYC